MPDTPKATLLRLYPEDQQHDWDNTDVADPHETELDTVVAIGRVLWFPVAVLLASLIVVASQ